MAFFLLIALAFVVWAALTMGQRAGRGARGATATTAAATAPSPATHKPWERTPEPEPTRQRGQRSQSAGRAHQQQPAVQGSLWERQPAAPEPSATRGRTDTDGSRVVITPRQPNTDAFERFLESEKRRD